MSSISSATYINNWRRARVEMLLNQKWKRIRENGSYMAMQRRHKTNLTTSCRDEQQTMGCCTRRPDSRLSSCCSPSKEKEEEGKKKREIIIIIQTTAPVVLSNPIARERHMALTNDSLVLFVLFFFLFLGRWRSPP